MNTSLRDQLLKAGLISKKQANEVERQSQRQERPVHAKHKQGKKPNPQHPAPTPRPDAARGGPSTARGVPDAARGSPDAARGAAAKTARDRELNRRRQEKAEAQARLAQIKQLIDQHRLAETPGIAESGTAASGGTGSDGGAPVEQFYNFVDGAKIRRIAVNDAIRDKLIRGEVVIVKFNARYDLVPAAIATRIGERDARCIVNSGVPSGETAAEAAYEGYAVPDDLMW